MSQKKRSAKKHSVKLCPQTRVFTLCQKIRSLVCVSWYKKYKKIYLYGALALIIIIYTVGSIYVNNAEWPVVPEDSDYIADAMYEYKPIDEIETDNTLVEQSYSLEHRMIFLLEYLDSINNEDYIIFIAASDEASLMFGDLLEHQFRQMGLNESLQGRFRYAYAAIIDGGRVVFEQLGESPMDFVSYTTEIGELIISIESAGFDTMVAEMAQTSININNNEYALATRGLNIVVYDKSLGKVIDSVSFDTCQDLTFRRSPQFIGVTLEGVSNGNFTNTSRPSSEIWLQHGYLVAHAMGELDGFGDHRYYTNSLEAFLQNYEAGHRFFELDLSLSSDGILFTRHAELGPFDTFEEEQAALPYTLLTFEEVAHLMLEFDDVFIITDTKVPWDYYLIRKQFDIIWSTLNDVCPSLLNRILIQFYTQHMYHILIENYDFPFLIYTLYMSPDTNEQVVEFARQHQIDAVVMHNSRASRNFVQQLGEIGAAVIVHFSGATTQPYQVYSLFADGVYGAMVFNLTYDDFTWSASERWEYFKAQR